MGRSATRCRRSTLRPPSCRRTCHIRRSSGRSIRPTRRSWCLASPRTACHSPEALAARGINLEDVRTVLGQANVDLPKGTLNSPRQTFTLNTNDQLFKPDQYADLVIAYRNGSPVRVRDIGRAISAGENELIAGWYNNQRAIILAIQRQPGANVIETVGRIKAMMPVLQASIPPAIKVNVISDRTQTIRASVADVQFTLMLTVALVVMVIFIFLRSFWATVI